MRPALDAVDERIPRHHLVAPTHRHTMKKDLTYKEAASRLDEIVRRIESESPDVDELTGLVKEAVELSKHCREKLTQADKQLSSLMAQLSEDPQAEG